MSSRKNIFILIGSAGKNSVNEKLTDIFIRLTKDVFSFTVFKDLKILPHFDPELSAGSPPEAITEFRNNIDKADGLLICTPEYVFSIPSGLKNAIEWCVSTTVFLDKPTGLITASASGEKAHEELQLIMRTLMSKFTDETTLLIQGAKGKINEQEQFSDNKTEKNFLKFIDAFTTLVNLS
ncbi:NADPH-dependent FMN reductase [Flavobacterium marginilacus]|uniref:NADPH-dependent FMN reductase n=1 Tax=Flavobacterium marginilacus TaxID=3003256 RepID=UPI00248D9041|nr:NADPH-dependent FMN reductase [Flavobacterium marginilacus]